ncbi:DUF6449 domain-containing protein [Halobacillus sp. KGW1]|uniref:DUF6449 domain-containing protein n=1 Tax=Halobacillus sp. KGW1 TaxID=1793726 RepID=UPI0007802FA2|nr:DUF6449 domain-containing protein [Halobacillus sp. KGW1]
MPLKTSSFNREIIKQDYRNVGWIAIVYFFGLFFFGPMQVWMSMSQKEPDFYNGTGMFEGAFLYEAQVVFVYLLPVLMAIFLFRYIQVRGAADFAHSFPVKRPALFMHHILSGASLLLAPLLLNYILLLVTALAADVSAYYTLGNLGYWLLLMVVITLLFFSVTVFIGMLTGLSAVQGVLSYIFLLLPAGLYALISYLLSSTVKGFSQNVILNESLDKFSPLLDIVVFERSYYVSGEGEVAGELPVANMSLLIYGAAAVFFYFAALYLYKKRPLEAASNALASPILHPVFKFGTMFCSALFGGMYFGLTQNSHSWMIAGFVIGGTIGYLLIVMLIEKTWRIFIWKHAKGWAGYALITAVMIAVIPFLWKGYESYIPSAGEVEKVYFGNGYYQYEESQREGSNYSFVRSKEAIEQVRAVHESLIAESEPLEKSGEDFFIGYQLDNGKEVLRQYYVDRKEITEGLKELYETEEYKNMHYPILQADISNIGKVDLYPVTNGSEMPRLYDPEKISGFVEALRKDLEGLTYEEMVDPKGFGTNIDFTVSGMENRGFLSTSVYPSYEHTMEWLKEEDLYEEVMVDSSMVDKVEVYPLGNDKYDTYDFEGYAMALQGEGYTPMTLNSADQIEAVMNADENWRENGYLFVYYLKGEDSENKVYLSMEEAEAPDFVKEHFE